MTNALLPCREVAVSDFMREHPPRLLDDFFAARRLPDPARHPIATFKTPPNPIYAAMAPDPDDPIYLPTVAAPADTARDRADLLDELSHLRDAMARRYLPVWWRRALDGLLRLVGFQDNRVIRDELITARDHLTARQRAVEQRLRDLAEKLSPTVQGIAALDGISQQIETLAANVVRITVADSYRDKCDQVSEQNRQLRGDLTDANLRIAELEQAAREWKQAEDGWFDTRDRFLTFLHGLSETRLLLDLKAAFTDATTGSSPRKRKAAIQKLETLHADLDEMIQATRALARFELDD